jgi:hypothetical protein
MDLSKEIWICIYAEQEPRLSIATVVEKCFFKKLIYF